MKIFLMTNTINKKAIGPLNEFDVQNRFLKRLQIASSPCKINVEIKKNIIQIKRGNQFNFLIKDYFLCLS